jgi:hypothetical protein
MESALHEHASGPSPMLILKKSKRSCEEVNSNSKIITELKNLNRLHTNNEQSVDGGNDILFIFAQIFF